MQRRLGSGRTLFLVSVLTYNADHRQDRTELTEVGTGRYYVWLVITENVKCLWITKLVNMNMLGIIAELSEAEGCMHIEINVYMFWTWTHTLHGTVYIEKT